MAVGIYYLNVHGTNGVENLDLDWNGAINPANLWIGFANWDSDTWEWYPGTADGLVEISEEEFGSFLRPGTWETVLAVVVLGTEPMVMRSLCTHEANLHPWPMFGHDPQHTHRSPYVGPQTSNVKWRFESYGEGTSFYEAVVGPDGTIYMGGGYKLHAMNPDGTVKWHSTIACTPVNRCALASDGTIYVHGITPNGSLYAINPDGSTKWVLETAGSESAPVLGPDGTIYVGTRDSYVIAANPDGSVKWSYRTDYMVISTPALATDGTVYVCDTGAGNLTKLYALNGDGTLKWTYPLPTTVFSSPVLDANENVVLNCEGQLYNLSPAGELNWSYGGCGGSTTPEIAADGTIYLGGKSGDYGALIALSSDGTEQWTSPTGLGFLYSPRLGPDGNIYVGSKDHYLLVFYPTGNLKSSIELDNRVHSRPAFGSDGTIYVGCYKDKFYAISPNGATEWDFSWGYSSGGAFKSSPAVAADGTIYVGCDDGRLYALDADGNEKWHYTTYSRFDDTTFPSSPAIGRDGSVYFGSSTYDTAIYAVNPDGSTRWTMPVEHGVSCPIVIGPDETIYVAGSDGEKYEYVYPYLKAIKPGGSLKWVYSSGQKGSPHTPALAQDGTLYCNDIHRVFKAIGHDGILKWESDTRGYMAIPAIAADGTIYTSDSSFYAYDSDGNCLWSFLNDFKFSSPGIGPNGTLYTGSYYSSNSCFHAINPDGSTKWQFDPGGYFTSSPAIGADGVVYVGCWDGKVYALNPDGTELWSYRTGGYVESSPAIGADGTVYVGSNDGTLYAFGPDDD